MYVSSVELVNWRSYADCTFTFPAPQTAKPLVLVGAMNGHGKTSFLLAFYFGLFGRHGVRYAEGFEIGPEAAPLRHYRQALEEFRRETADPDHPTIVDITISPSQLDLAAGGLAAVELRIVRTWYFTRAGRWRDRDEQVLVYVDGLPQPLNEHDDALAYIERHFVPAHVLPAFFFDGEQAGRRINDAGESQMRDAVQVLYGTKLLDELDDRLKRFVVRQRGAGKIGTKDARQDRLGDLRERRDSVESQLRDCEAEHRQRIQELDEAKDVLRECQDQLQRLGSTSQQELDQMRTESERVVRELAAAKARCDVALTELPLDLVIHKYGAGLREQLLQEDRLAAWQTVRDSVSRRSAELQDAVAARIAQMPSMASDVEGAVRNAVSSALRQLYAERPVDAAKVRRHVHLDAGRRATLLNLVAHRKLHSAEEFLGDLDAVTDLEGRRARASVRADQDSKRERIEKAVQQLDAAYSEVTRIAGETARLEVRMVPLREQTRQLRQEVTRLDGQLQNMAPFEAMMEVAERVRDVLSEFQSSLQPLGMRRLEASVTRHFQAIADERYGQAVVRFEEDGSTTLETPSGSRPIRVMSGYERRSFGIAFSLALAEVSGFRAPLIIDTPVGNADSSYRLSILRHLVDCGLDQVILLTHDEEVTGLYHDAVREHVCAHLLIENGTADGDERTRESIVHVDRYFGEV